MAIRADHFRPVADTVAQHRGAEALRTEEQQLSSLRRRLVEGRPRVAAHAAPSNHGGQEPMRRWGRRGARRRDLLRHRQNLPLRPQSRLECVDVDILHFPGKVFFRFSIEIPQHHQMEGHRTMLKFARRPIKASRNKNTSE